MRGGTGWYGCKNSHLPGPNEKKTSTTNENCREFQVKREHFVILVWPRLYNKRTAPRVAKIVTFSCLLRESFNTGRTTFYPGSGLKNWNHSIL